MRNKVPHPIPYQGSKRNIAKHILSLFPEQIDTLVEPFAGSAAISIAAAYYNYADKFHLNDINKPLALLLEQIINEPEDIVEKYEEMWKEQNGKEKEYYNYIREEFNNDGSPGHLLFLLARCVKGAIRYNTKGKFNQSPDNRRKGKIPENMGKEIFAFSKLLKGKTIVTSCDYKDVLKKVTQTDLVYMDPPYQGVCNSRDTRYYNSIDFDKFMVEIGKLVGQGDTIYISYDGKRGDTEYGKKLPEELNLRHTLINAGRSTQSTLLGEKDITYESIYLSPILEGSLKENAEIKFKGLKDGQITQTTFSAYN